MLLAATDTASFFVALGSLGVAVCAFWVALMESRRNGSAVLKIVEQQSGATQTVDENSGELFVLYRVRILNIGIPLHDPQASICFDRDASRNSSVTFKLANDQDGTEFSKGMIATFEFKSYQTPLMFRKILAELHDSKKQNAYLLITSQGYDAKTFHASAPLDRLKGVWNRALSAIGNGQVGRRFSSRFFGNEFRFWLWIKRFRAQSVAGPLQAIGSNTRSELKHEQAEGS